MILAEIPAAIADIGAEVRAVADLPIPPQFLDITFHLDDGSSIDLTVDKPVYQASRRMHKLCRWLGRRKGNRVDYIETYGVGGSTHYVVSKPVDYSRWLGALTKVQAV